MPVRRVQPDDLRREFRNQRIPERLADGSLWSLVKSEKVPSPPLAHEPPGTKSQIIYVYEGIQKVAVMHQYLRPDGTIGASGQPDPKRLVVEGDVWYV